MAGLIAFAVLSVGFGGEQAGPLLLTGESVLLGAFVLVMGGWSPTARRATFAARDGALWDATDPGPVADTVCFLLSDLGRAISGEVLHVDGGYHALAAPGLQVGSTADA